MKEAEHSLGLSFEASEAELLSNHPTSGKLTAKAKGVRRGYDNSLDAALLHSSGPVTQKGLRQRRVQVGRSLHVAHHSKRSHAISYAGDIPAVTFGAGLSGASPADQSRLRIQGARIMGLLQAEPSEWSHGSTCRQIQNPSCRLSRARVAEYHNKFSLSSA